MSFRTGVVPVAPSWTLIGVAPATVSLVSRNNFVYVLVGDAAPTDGNAEGALLSTDQPSLDVKAAGNIYARAIGPDATSYVDVLSQPALGHAYVTASDGTPLEISSLDQALGWNTDGTLGYLQVVSGGNTYRQSMTWTGGQLTAISKWVKQ